MSWTRRLTWLGVCVLIAGLRTKGKARVVPDANASGKASATPVDPSIEATT